MKIYLENYSDYPCVWILPTIQYVKSNKGFRVYLLFLKYGIEIEYTKK